MWPGCPFEFLFSFSLSGVVAAYACIVGTSGLDLYKSEFLVSPF